MDLNPGPNGSDPDILGALNGHVVFWGEDGTEDGLERLWANNGMVGNATLLGTFDRRGSSGEAVLFGDHLYFPAEVTATTGTELWRTDGTVGGTEVIDLEPGQASSNPREFAVAGDRLYFQAYDSVAKVELHYLVYETVLFADGFESGDVLAWE